MNPREPYVTVRTPSAANKSTINVWFATTLLIITAALALLAWRSTRTQESDGRDLDERSGGQQRSTVPRAVADVAIPERPLRTASGKDRVAARYRPLESPVPEEAAPSVVPPRIDQLVEYGDFVISLLPEARQRDETDEHYKLRRWAADRYREFIAMAGLNEDQERRLRMTLAQAYLRHYVGTYMMPIITPDDPEGREWVAATDAADKSAREEMQAAFATFLTPSQVAILKKYTELYREISSAWFLFSMQPRK
jgi:hypothetical protein